MPIRVLIVDDSALMREMLTQILNADQEIEVVDTASDPLIAREKIKKLNPDVLTLDVEMPRMNGIEFLCRLMALRPMPVIMVSSLTQEGTDTTLRALQLGAVDFIGKPTGFIGDDLADMADLIRQKVKSAARSKVVPTLARNVLREKATVPMTDRLIAIGASTGGVPAVGSILQSLPPDTPPVLIAQHMPPGFTLRFASRLDEECEIRVVEAKDGMTARQGYAYIAPGGFQMRIAKGRRIRVINEGRVNGFCPCVDELFDSVAQHEGEKSVGVILTGMGRDGANGILAIRRAGGRTLGQDEATSVVYGMPRVAWEKGGVERQYPVDRIGDALLRVCASSLSDSSQFTYP